MEDRTSAYSTHSTRRRAPRAAQPSPMNVYTYGSAAPALDYPEFNTPASRPRPSLDVLHGAGRDSDRGVSPEFARAVRGVAIALAVFFAVAFGQIFLSSLAAGMMQANLQAEIALEASEESVADLEAKRSVLASSQRIHDIASERLGMVDGEGGVVVDLGETAQ